MLSSRNRRLKRLSRFLAFFVIVFSGCYYQLNKLYDNFKEYTSADDFIEESPLVPPFVKNIHKQKYKLNVRKQIMGGATLPPEDEHELMYRDRYLEEIKGQKVTHSQLERRMGIIRTKNPYTQALKR